MIARPATAAAPRTTPEASGRAGPRRPAARHRGRGPRPAHRSRLARGGEEGVDHFPLTGDVGVGGWTSAPRTRRRARLASCLAVAGERPTIGAISSKGRSNMSCRTNASRSAGARVSSTTCSASPTESASSASSSGLVPSARLTTGSGTCTPDGLLTPRVARTQHVQAHPGDDRGQPAAEVIDAAGVRPAQAQPGFLDGVVGLGERAEHPVGHRPQVGPVPSKPSASQSDSAIGHTPWSRRVIQVTPQTRSM